MIDRYFWDNVDVGNGRHHSIPLADDVAHETADDCICGPTVVDLTKAGCDPFVLVQHRSLDSREQIEREHAEAFFDLLRSHDESS